MQKPPCSPPVRARTHPHPRSLLSPQPHPHPPTHTAITAAAAGEYVTVNGARVKKYRGMGSLEAMGRGSEARYHSDTQSLKIAQGVSGTGAGRCCCCCGGGCGGGARVVHCWKEGGRCGCCQLLGASSRAVMPCPAASAAASAAAVRDKGSVRRSVPYLAQAVKQGFQASSAPASPHRPEHVAAPSSSHCHSPPHAHTPSSNLLLLLLLLLRPPQDLGAKSIVDAWRRLDSGAQRLESRTGAAQAEGGVHDMHSFDKRSW